MQHTIYEVLEQYIKKQSVADEKGVLRPTVILADNWNRKFEITVLGSVVAVNIVDSSLGKIPKLDGIFTFHLEGCYTDASQCQTEEIQKILEIRDFTESVSA